MIPYYSQRYCRYRVKGQLKYTTYSGGIQACSRVFIESQQVIMYKSFTQTTHSETDIEYHTLADIYSIFEGDKRPTFTNFILKTKKPYQT